MACSSTLHRELVEGSKRAATANGTQFRLRQNAGRGSGRKSKRLHGAHYTPARQSVDKLGEGERKCAIQMDNLNLVEVDKVQFDFESFFAIRRSCLSHLGGPHWAGHDNKSNMEKETYTSPLCER